MAVRYNNYFNVYIDTAPTIQMLDLVNLALSPASLLDFLETDAHDYLVEQIQLRFAYEGDKKSGSWPWLSETTIRIRESQGFPGPSPINHRTGELEEFLTDFYEIDASLTGAELKIPGSPNSSVIERKLRTAQEGNPTNPIPGFGPTPARPVLATGADDLAVLLERLQVHIIDTVIHGALA